MPLCLTESIIEVEGDNTCSLVTVHSLMLTGKYNLTCLNFCNIDIDIDRKK